jgi:hypothetical protein
MKRSRFTDEQMIGALQQLDGGVSAKDVKTSVDAQNISRPGFRLGDGWLAAKTRTLCVCVFQDSLNR